MLPKRVTTCVCVRGQQWTFPLARPPFPTASAPRTFQQKETLHLQPSHCPYWGRVDIPTSSHSFLLLWKIKVKKTSINQLLQHLLRTCFSHHWRREGREGTEQRCSWTSHNLWITSKCFLLLCNDQRNEADIGVFFPQLYLMRANS